MKALDIALYFLFRARELEAGDTISNLKMQKLLYFAQGYFLAIFDKPCFNDKIEAWKYGPVVKNVYDKFKIYSNLAIDFKELENFNSEIYTKEYLDMLPYIFNKYNISATELVTKTHNEGPWKDYFNEYIPQEIPIKALKKFFDETLKNKAKRYIS